MYRLCTIFGSCHRVGIHGRIELRPKFIVCVVREMEIHFINGRIGDKFTYWRTGEHPDLDDLMYKLVDLVNEGLGL